MSLGNPGIDSKNVDLSQNLLLSIVSYLQKILFKYTRFCLKKYIK